MKDKLGVRKMKLGYEVKREITEYLDKPKLEGRIADLEEQETQMNLQIARTMEQVKVMENELVLIKRNKELLQEALATGSASTEDNR